MHALLYFLAQLFEVLLKFLKGVRLVPSTRETLGDISFGMISIRPLITRINHGPWDVVTWRKEGGKGTFFPPFLSASIISVSEGESTTFNISPIHLLLLPSFPSFPRSINLLEKEIVR